MLMCGAWLHGEGSGERESIGQWAEARNLSYLIIFPPLQGGGGQAMVVDNATNSPRIHIERAQHIHKEPSTYI